MPIQLDLADEQAVKGTRKGWKETKKRMEGNKERMERNKDVDGKKKGRRLKARNIPDRHAESATCVSVPVR